ncbi:hypothetical protein [Rufibacter sp. LB8]|uniref:hypothetical protein n=1 Tax=Rufibacter sp. LB8 TaxID=2777781 RepID=UPI00178C8065|nr:hypothetical protein [Rufibacter sp. LB8]
MNESNLEHLKKELEDLKFGFPVQEALEKNLQLQLPDFQLRHAVPTEKGQVDFTLHFRKSNQSDFYFFNKYDASLSKIPPLEKGQKFMVVSSDPQARKSSFITFQSPVEAIRHFKKLEGTHELAVGRNVKDKTTLATKQDGKVSLVEENFKQTFYKPDVSHTFYLDKGKGFTAEQASNLLQGRSVFRDDFVSLEGQRYQAWTRIDFDQPKDQHGNHVLAQYHHPAYGFDQEKALEKYALKEMEDPAAKAALLQALRQGERPLVTTMKDGQETQVFLEASPRFKNFNIFNTEGKQEKREQFEKKPEVGIRMEKGITHSRGEESGLAVSV